jgi:hypothetical protein
MKHQTKPIISKRLLGAAILSAALITPAVASAQSYGDQQIQGQVASINGTWNISVDDSNGNMDSVELHQGTIINPTGLTLAPGMSVTIDGYPDGPNFDANEIDTPYAYTGPAPQPVYYGPGNWYPGYAAGWGPSFSLVFNVGTRQWAQRPFAYGGQVRQPMAPPVGVAFQQRSYAPAPQRNIAPAPQRAFAPPAAPQRTFSAPAAQRFTAPVQRFSAPAQHDSAPAQHASASQRGGGPTGRHQR